jgi:hypothetical protein
MHAYAVATDDEELAARAMDAMCRLDLRGCDHEPGARP